MDAQPAAAKSGGTPTKSGAVAGGPFFSSLQVIEGFGAPGEIRTPDLLIRSLFRKVSTACCIIYSVYKDTCYKDT
jgi:hypothetical protein